ncbi:MULTISPECIES: CocE/NonD family hydrolase [unclassified Microbacterium]|uniref:CocE/NonD family hydrolase n=1 Tax=unclassified Microbacterium TaxID=2609290 RepID=UPI0036469237
MFDRDIHSASVSIYKDEAFPLISACGQGGAWVSAGRGGSLDTKGLRLLQELTDAELELIRVDIGALGPDRVGREYVAVTAADGAVLHGTLTRPQEVNPRPVIVIRTPYGRSELDGAAAYLSSRGYAVLVQDTRSATSYFSEAGDGRSTADWATSQSWCDGTLLLAGFSYLGFTAWATASTRPPALRAMSIAEYSTDRVSAWYPGGALTLDLALSWSLQNEANSSEPHPPADAFDVLPLGDAGEAAAGGPLPFFRERLMHGADSSHWAPLDYSSTAEDAGIPVLLFDGWYDYQRIPLFQDFERLGRMGAPRRLVFGPWTHNPIEMTRYLDETLTWFDLHAKGMGTAPAEASLYDTGARGWVEFDRWPANPPQQVFHATPNRLLSVEPVEGSTFIGWAYDPDDPTPAVGLTAFGGLEVGGPQDNRTLLDRSDTVVFTADPLAEDLDAVGRVRVRSTVRSDAPSTDFFVRLLDVTADGVAANVCDAICRVTDPQLSSSNGVVVELDLGPIAHRFLAGHRPAVLVASGAYPYYDRNLGFGDPLLTAVRRRIAHPSVCIGGTDGLSITLTLRQ